MPRTNFKIIINFLLILGLLAPVLSFAQTDQPPQTIKEAGGLIFSILERLPAAIKDVWQNQALPIWLNMWSWAKGFWESTLGAKVQSLWEKLWGLTGQDTPNIEEEFQKEKEEMGKDLWERFKDLLK